MLNNITNELKREFHPAAVLVVYSSENSAYVSQEARYYLESRPVKHDGTLGVAKPVSKEFVTALVTAFRKEGETVPRGLMPRNFLYADSRMGMEKYVWWEPPQKKTMYFTEDIPLPDAEYDVPGTIYCVDENRLSVFCFKGRRPAENAELYFGPFYNYYTDGHICLGTAKATMPEDIHWQDVIDYWETLFWKSENSHMMNNPLTENNNLNLVLKECMDKPFPFEVLRKADIRLKSLYK